MATARRPASCLSCLAQSLPVELWADPEALADELVEERPDCREATLTLGDEGQPGEAKHLTDRPFGAVESA